MYRIQNGYMDFLPLQVCERSWKFCRLSVQTCLLQFISFLDLKYPSSYLFKTFLLILTCVYHICWVPPPPLSSEPCQGRRRHRRSPHLNGREATGEVVAARLLGLIPRSRRTRTAEGRYGDAK